MWSSCKLQEQFTPHQYYSFKYNVITGRRKLVLQNTGKPSKIKFCSISVRYTITAKYTSCNFCLLLAESCKHKCLQLPPERHHEKVEGTSWDSLNSNTHKLLPHNAVARRWIHTAQNNLLLCRPIVQAVWIHLRRVDVTIRTYKPTGQWNNICTNNVHMWFCLNPNPY